jgi:hypothetical protein
MADISYAMINPEEYKCKIKATGISSVLLDMSSGATHLRYCCGGQALAPVDTMPARKIAHIVSERGRLRQLLLLEGATLAPVIEKQLQKIRSCMRI